MTDRQPRKGTLGRVATGLEYETTYSGWQPVFIVPYRTQRRRVPTIAYRITAGNGSERLGGSSYLNLDAAWRVVRAFERFSRSVRPIKGA